MKIGEITDKRFGGILIDTDDVVEVVASDNGSGDEYNIYRDGKHFGCLYDDSGYKFSAGAFAGENYT